MHSDNRPLSPHLQVYKLPLPAVMSISHRISGVALCVGAIGLVYWLVSLATGPAAFEAAQGFMGSFLGKLILFAFSYGLFYHLCNGIRHLFWDAVIGMDIETVYKTGYVVLAASVALTLLTWILVFALGGGA